MKSGDALLREGHGLLEGVGIVPGQAEDQLPLHPQAGLIGGAALTGGQLVVDHTDGALEIAEGLLPGDAVRKADIQILELLVDTHGVYSFL